MTLPANRDFGDTEIMGRTWLAAIVVVSTSSIAYADAWNHRNAATNPGSRDGARFAYDSLRSRLILYGGHQAGACGDLAYRQTWSYSYATNTWTDLAPANDPGQHVHFAMTYDSVHDKVLAFGTQNFPCPSTPADEHLWAYDPGTNTWTDMDLTMDPLAPRPAPAGLLRHMVFADQAGVAILYGNSGGATARETWAYDFGTNRWTNLAPPTTPSQGVGFAIGYDSRNRRIAIFGGSFNGGPPRRETWSYDVAANDWTDRTDATAPMPDAGQDPSMAYDCHSHRYVLVDDSDVTWSLDPETFTWQQMAPNPVTPSVHHFAFAYVPDVDRVVLYPAEFTRQTWEYDDQIAPTDCALPIGPSDGANLTEGMPSTDAGTEPPGTPGGCCGAGRGRATTGTVFGLVVMLVLRRRRR